MRDGKELNLEEMNQVNGGTGIEFSEYMMKCNDETSHYDVYKNDVRVARFFKEQDANQYMDFMMSMDDK